jgi:hypothetical protein
MTQESRASVKAKARPPALNLPTMKIYDVFGRFIGVCLNERQRCNLGETRKFSQIEQIVFNVKHFNGDKM